MSEPIQINSLSRTPIYKQIIQSVRTAIEDGSLTYGQRLPSINSIRGRYFISRDTVIKAYQELKATGVVASSPGKGYFVACSKIGKERHIFLLLDEFNIYKETVYYAFRDRLKDESTIDLFFHHYDQKVYRSLIELNSDHYTDYVITPLTDNMSIEELKQNLGGQNLYILDQGYMDLGEDYPSVCQDFKLDIVRALKSGLSILKKYKKLILVIPGADDLSRQQIRNNIIEGVEIFCKKNKMKVEILNGIGDREPQSRECYLIYPDSELVVMIEKLQTPEMKKKKVGLISFNESPLKAVAAGGMSTLSTDFEAMGAKMAEMVQEKSEAHVKNRYGLIIRSSLRPDK